MFAVRDIVARVDDAFPYAWAESWDNVGLVVGDPARPVEGVLVSLDADVPTIERAGELGANVLVTHHPPFLETPKKITPALSPALWSASCLGIAVISAHTNLDRSPLASPVLLRRLGIADGRPLETSLAQESLITVFAPVGAAQAVRDALATAGAGRISSYDGCTFSVEGAGRFAPRPEAHATVTPESGDGAVAEVRIEAVASMDGASRIARSAAAAHPYDEPLITVTPLERHRGEVALGRVAELSTTDLGELVSRVSAEFDCTPRVWGDARKSISRIATATGSAGSLVPSAIASGADVLLAGEVRYHDALDAMHAGLAIIEAGHDVTEWPLVPILAREITALPGFDESILTAATPTRDWWTP